MQHRVICCALSTIDNILYFTRCCILLPMQFILVDNRKEREVVGASNARPRPFRRLLNVMRWRKQRGAAPGPEVGTYVRY
jgi:hypothetical protein